MAWKNLSQRSFADNLMQPHDAITELDDAHDLIDWSRIGSLLAGIHNKKRGEQAWPPLMMFKALLLQSWYGLSDPQLEKQIARDLLFRRFIGLSLSESVPDHSTLWRFRNRLERDNLRESLLEEINQQLCTQGAIVKRGGISIVDATVIKAQRNRPHKNAEDKNTQDPEAGYSVKLGSDGRMKTTYGYKAHVNVDEDGFVKATDFTAGNVHDSQCFKELLDGDEESAYADSAYKSAAHDVWLAERGIENCVLERAYRNKPLTPEQKIHNRRCSKIRSTVERVFGVMKLHQGMGAARYVGLARNRIRFGLICMAHNLKTGISILREMRVCRDELELSRERCV